MPYSVLCNDKSIPYRHGVLFMNGYVEGFRLKGYGYNNYMP